MWYILLILLFLYIWWQWRRIFKPLRDAMPPFGRGQRNSGGEEYTETGERKKYTRDEGEYADFEEVSVGTVIEETVSTEGDTRTVIEEQVTDAEYEEIRE